MSEKNIKVDLNRFCKKNKKEFSFPKIYIDEDNDLHYNSLNNIYISSCYIEKNGLFYNNNEVLINIIAYKRELNISDLYLEFDGRNLSVAISPEYNSINEGYFNELGSMPFTIGMINKIQREADKLVRCQAMLKYLRLLDVKKSLILIQYILFHSLMTITEVLDIFKLYLYHLDEALGFSNLNNIVFLQKALFCQFSINDIYFCSSITQ